MGKDCVFCRIIRGETPTEILHATEYLVVFRDIRPQGLRLDWLFRSDDMEKVNDPRLQNIERDRDSGVLTISDPVVLGAGVTRAAQKRVMNAGVLAKAGTATGWETATVNSLCLATLAAGLSAKALVVPVPGLKVGDTITAFHLIGQVESAGNNVTIDAALRKHTAAATDVADASVGAITQLVVAVDSILSASNAGKTGLSEVVGADETFYVLITATTTTDTDIALQGVAASQEDDAKTYAARHLLGQAGQLVLDGRSQSAMRLLSEPVARSGGLRYC